MHSTPELRLPTVAVPVRIAFVDTRELAAELFVIDLPGRGRGELLDALAHALDAEAAFVPVRVGGEVRLIAKRAIAWIAADRDEAEGETTLYDRQHHVSIEIAGRALAGLLFDSSPADRPRVVDHLNASRRFVRLWTSDEHYLVNRDHIVQVAELPAEQPNPSES
jgi:hypothetical protein